MLFPSELLSLESGVLDSEILVCMIADHTQAAEVSLGYCLLPSNLCQFGKECQLKGIFNLYISDLEEELVL